MIEYLKLLPGTIPDSLKWVVSFIIHLSVLFLFIEKIYSFIRKESSERRIRKIENQKLYQDLIGSNKALQDFNSEVNCFEAFYLLTRIRACKQRREKLLDLMNLGFLNHTQLKYIDPYIETLEDGRFKIQLGFSEFWSVAFGFIGILFVGIAMMTMHFLFSKNGGMITLYSTAIGSLIIFIIALCTKNDVRRISLTLKSCKELNNRNLLEGEFTFKGQFCNAFKNERKAIFVIISISLSIMIFSWFLAHLAKG